MSKEEEMKHSISCGAVAWRTKRFSDGTNTIEILLIKQFSDKEGWGIPKGHMDEGETFEQCAAREVREETGIDVVLGERLMDVTTSWKHEHKRVISFLATQNGTNAPDISDPDCEVADVKWHDVNYLPKIHIYQRQLIESVILKFENEGLITKRASTYSQKRYIVESLLSEWLDVPDLRLGQFLSNATNGRSKSLFYVEDYELRRRCRDFAMTQKKFNR